MTSRWAITRQVSRGLPTAPLRRDSRVSIRPSAIGKKNWLFIGSLQAGGRSAIIYSVLITCQRFGVDPRDYLKDVLARIPAMSNQADYTQLMPQN
jgi:hypothetical protein